MANTVAARKRSNGRRTKVKTGCATCRIRKVKCDENKPFCQKCVKTGRTCDGYESPFKFYTNQPIINETHAVGIEPNIPGSRPIGPTLPEITPQDIELLNRYFSTKTMLDVKLGCDEEAKQLLQASLTDPPLRHAVLSLKALRQDLETSGDGSVSLAQQARSYSYGLQQYNIALGGLASNLASFDSNGLKSALLCCQIFISIEQVLGNYAAMAQHIIRGLRIMHECRARPGFVAMNKLLPAYHDQLPLLDVFIVKLFAAPCKFADPPTTVDLSDTSLPTSSISPHRQPVQPRNLRTIAPNMQTELTRIATLTIELLGRVSQLKSVEDALRLQSNKIALLDCLESWLNDLELARIDIGHSGSEPLSVCFLRLFYHVLRIVLLGALDYSPATNSELLTESDRLQCIAKDIGERVSGYRMCERN
ncbi:hypothetical protein BGZ63DRAFT_357626 [Mariannaea sp. PMI_226]|nr:hypothetical protein BGZ63DRAFT_357626 [Mariannaea sp. PMI_226]